MKSRRKIRGDTIVRPVRWQNFIKVGTLVKYMDTTGKRLVGQVVEVDRKCERGMHLKIRSFTENLWQASYCHNNQIIGIHRSPKIGCWIPVKEYQDNYRKRVKTLPFRRYARHFV